MDLANIGKRKLYSPHDCEQHTEPPYRRRQFPPALLACCILTLSSCGGESTPTANSYAFATAEDIALRSQVDTADSGKDGLTYLVLHQPEHGTLELNPSNGSFVYVPTADFFGMDGFLYAVRKGTRQSAPASVSIFVAPVQDPPRITGAARVLKSSPDEYPTRVALTIMDVDGDALHIEAESNNKEIVSVSADPVTGELYLSPKSAGIAEIRVRVSDGYHEVIERYQFESAPIRTIRTVNLESPESSVLELENVADFPVQFRLDVNGFMYPGSRPEILSRMSLKATRASESILISTWRSIAESTRRGATLSEATWLHAPARILNSLGFGYCDDVASAFAHLIAEAGYETRVWTLAGHVVAEVLVDGRWEMYDPDLGVIYRNEQGQIAGVEELAANPALITTPLDPILARKFDDRAPFSQEVADIYASVSDNVIFDRYTIPIPQSDSTLTLPPGGRLIFGEPSNVALPDAPTGQAIPFMRQARIQLPSGWTGDLPTAFVIVAADGIGTMEIGGVEYEIGSPELSALLSDMNRPQQEPKVLRADSTLCITILVNALAGNLQSANSVMLSGLNIGAIKVQGRQNN